MPVDLPPAEADLTQLERALRNLLDNALQHTPPQGWIAIAARTAAQDRVEIEVSDTGRGIPEADLPRIFERFYRSDKSRERHHGHSGLGLAIVREIVEAHGSQVTVQSEAGKGASFHFTLQRATNLAAQPELAAGAEPRPQVAPR